MMALTEQQIMTCCACQSYASTLSTVLAEARSSEDVVAAARDVWWKQVQRLPLFDPSAANSMHAWACSAYAAAWLHGNGLARRLSVCTTNQP